MVNEQAANFSGYVRAGANSGQNVNCKSFVASGSIEVGNLAYCEGNLSCAGELYLRDGYQSEKVAGSGTTNNSSNYRLLNLNNVANTVGAAAISHNGIFIATVAELSTGLIFNDPGGSGAIIMPSDASFRAFVMPNGQLIGDGVRISFTIMNIASDLQVGETISLMAGNGGSHRGATGGGTVTNPIMAGGSAGRFMIVMNAGGAGYLIYRMACNLA